MADRERNGYILSTDPDRVDIDVVHRWLSENAYWALGRPRDVVEASVKKCDVWSVFAPDGAQVAFTRAVTDGLTFGWICDVYVDPAHRGRGRPDGGRRRSARAGDEQRARCVPAGRLHDPRRGPLHGAGHPQQNRADAVGLMTGTRDDQGKLMARAS